MRLHRSASEKLGIGYGNVNSIDGYDEISLTGNFKVKTNTMEKIFRPADLGLPTIHPEELYGGATPDEAAEIFDSVLENRSTESRKNVVLPMRPLPSKSSNGTRTSPNASPSPANRWKADVP